MASPRRSGRERAPSARQLLSNTARTPQPWTQDERIVLKILNEEIKQDPVKRVKVFNLVFPERQRDRARLRSAWSERGRKERHVTIAWEVVLKGPKGRDERMRWRGLEGRVREAIEKFNEEMDEESIQEEDQEQEEEAEVLEEEEENIADAQLQPQDAAISTVTETSLKMIHHSQVIWAGDQAYWTAKQQPDNIPISQTSQIYQLGGKVHRVLDWKGNSIDMIICNTHFCGPCRSTVPPTPEQLANTAEGYHFVHTIDTQKSREDGKLHFKPVRSPAFDRHNSPFTEAVKRSVVYGDGIARMTRVCKLKKCTVCATPVMLRSVAAQEEVGDGYENDDESTAETEEQLWTGIYTADTP